MGQVYQGAVYNTRAKDGFYVLSGSVSACIITPVLPGDLQSLKYLLSSLQRKCLLSLLFKDKQASGMEVQVAVAALYGDCCVTSLFRHTGTLHHSSLNKCFTSVSYGVSV